MWQVLVYFRVVYCGNFLDSLHLNSIPWKRMTDISFITFEYELVCQVLVQFRVVNRGIFLFSVQLNDVTCNGMTGISMFSRRDIVSGTCSFSRCLQCKLLTVCSKMTLPKKTWMTYRFFEWDNVAGTCSFLRCLLGNFLNIVAKCRCLKRFELHIHQKIDWSSVVGSCLNLSIPAIFDHFWFFFSFAASHLKNPGPSPKNFWSLSLNLEGGKYPGISRDSYFLFIYKFDSVKTTPKWNVWIIAICIWWNDDLCIAILDENVSSKKFPMTMKILLYFCRLQ